MTDAITAVTVVASYYTDPCCPWSWALEPAFRRLRWELGEALEVTYVMCGMAQQFEDPVLPLREGLSAGAASGMPVDGRLWLESPLRSSHPACIAVKAAAEQRTPERYLRRLREGIMCRRRRLDTAEALVEEARLAGGVDVERFRIDLSSHATLESFGADLERAKATPAEHHAEGSDRVKLPSLEFRGDDGTVAGVYGYADYAVLAAAARDAGAEPAGRQPPAVEHALRHFGAMSAAEVAAVCQLPGPRAPAELWRLATEWRVRPEKVGGGELWTVV